MGPSWVKMGSGSELEAIFGRLRRKMEVKIDVRAILRRSWGDLGAEEGDMGQNYSIDLLKL